MLARFMKISKIGPCGILLGVAVSAMLAQAAEGDEEGADVPELPHGRGWLLLDVAAERKIQSLQLDRIDGRAGSGDLGSVKAGRALKAIELPEGHYQWKAIELPHYDLPFRQVVADDERWRFSIKEDAVNYVGQIIVGEERGSNYVDVRLVNRTAMNLSQIEQEFEPYLERYPLVYSGAARDDFLDAYRKLRDEGNPNDVE